MRNTALLSSPTSSCSLLDREPVIALWRDLKVCLLPPSVGLPTLLQKHSLWTLGLILIALTAATHTLTPTQVIEQGLLKSFTRANWESFRTDGA